jgi:hypothetical protein
MSINTPRRDAGTSRAWRFVLSGGTSLGAVQVGLLRALTERGIRPDLVDATPVRAVNGAFIASHGPTKDSLDELGDLWRGARRGNVFLPGPPPCPIDVQPIDFRHADALMTRAEKDTQAILARRDAGSVHGSRRRRTWPGPRAGLRRGS